MLFLRLSRCQTRRSRLEAKDANGKPARVLLPQRLCQWHLFALFCLRGAVPKVAARPVVCALVSAFWGVRGDPCKRLQTDAGRAAQSTKKFYLHARPRLNASTVCVFSFEQSAYSKQIAEERKDTHSKQLTPEERAALVNGKTFVINERPFSIARQL